MIAEKVQVDVENAVLAHGGKHSPDVPKDVLARAERFQVFGAEEHLTAPTVYDGVPFKLAFKTPVKQMQKDLKEMAHLDNSQLTKQSACLVVLIDLLLRDCL